MLNETLQLDRITGKITCRFAGTQAFSANQEKRTQYLYRIKKFKATRKQTLIWDPAQPTKPH